MATFGRETRIRLIGGDLVIRETGGDTEGTRRSIQQMKARALDLRVPFEQFRPVWQASIAATFAAQGRPSGWPPLSPRYRAWKDRWLEAHSMSDRGMMRLTDRLYDSLTSSTSDTIWEATPRAVRFGTRVPYWRRHQRGYRMPARPTLVLQPADLDALTRLVTRYVHQGGGR